MENLIRAGIDAQEVFKYELNHIFDGTLRNFVVKIFNHVDPAFTEIAASSSGKNHPKQQNGIGGLVRHTRAVVYMARRLAKTYELDAYQASLVVAGALLHDIAKPLEIKNGGTVAGCHDLIAVELNKSLSVDNADLDSGSLNAVLEMVGYHMGIWGTNKNNLSCLSDIALIVHLADYTSSQKRLHFDNIDVINEF